MIAICPGAPMGDDLQFWITAVHEASHAVAAHELRHKVTAVTIVRDGIVLGTTTIPTIGDWNDLEGEALDPKFMRRYQKRKRGAVAIYLAGDVGNHIDGKMRHPLVSKRVPAGVFEQIMAHGHAAPGVHEMDDVKRAIALSLECWDEPTKEIENAEKRVETVLRAHWPKTLHLARLAMERKTIEGEALDSVLRQNKWVHLTT